MPTLGKQKFFRIYLPVILGIILIVSAGLAYSALLRKPATPAVTGAVLGASSLSPQPAAAPQTNPLLTQINATAAKPQSQAGDPLVRGGVKVHGGIVMGNSGTNAGVGGNGYLYGKTITIDHTKVGTVNNSDQLYFSVLVCANGASPCNISVPGLNQTGGGAQVNNSNGYDIVFTSDPGCATKLNWEMEDYVASTGEMEAWIKIPTLSHSVNTIFYMCYGNSSISTFQGNIAGTWNDGGSNFYKGVWHFPNGSTLSANDSTANGNNGTLNNSPSATAGQIDGGVKFVSASSQRISMSTISSLDSSTKAVLSGWFKRTSVGSLVLWGQDDGSAGDRFSIQVYSDGNVYVAAENGSAAYGYFSTNDTSWHYIAAVYDGTQSTNATRLAVYLDGTQKTLTFSGTIPSNLDPSFINPFYVGYAPSLPAYSDGSIDEVRVASGVARSADWIKTEYNNQSSPSTFYTIN